MGVTRRVVAAGDGKTFPQKGDVLTMHYTGRLLSDGSKFDSSVDRGQPFQFTIGVGQVILGWDRGVAEMSLGEKVRRRALPLSLARPSTTTAVSTWCSVVLLTVVLHSGTFACFLARAATVRRCSRSLLILGTARAVREASSRRMPTWSSRWSCWESGVPGPRGAVGGATSCEASNAPATRF
jgi:FK506-binding protein 1